MLYVLLYVMLCLYNGPYLFCLLIFLVRFYFRRSDQRKLEKNKIKAFKDANDKRLCVSSFYSRLKGIILPVRVQGHSLVLDYHILVNFNELVESKRKLGLMCNIIVHATL